MLALGIATLLFGHQLLSLLSRTGLLTVFYDLPCPRSRPLWRPECVSWVCFLYVAGLGRDVAWAAQSASKYPLLSTCEMQCALMATWHLVYQVLV